MIEKYPRIPFVPETQWLYASISYLYDLHLIISAEEEIFSLFCVDPERLQDTILRILEYLRVRTLLQRLAPQMPKPE